MDDLSLWSDDRHTMVTQQIEARGIHDPRLLDVMRRVPRHIFVPGAVQSLAYSDSPLPIGAGQTISQPYIVALMTHLLELSGSETVLEIGTGSGYQAAILGGLAARVFTIERHHSLVENARRALESLQQTNVTVIEGDGSFGLPEHAPYQGILVSAAAPDAPRPLLEQLDDGGRLILPVGGEYGQYLQVYQRKGDTIDHRPVTPVAFVPLRGRFGWSETEWGDRQ